MVRYRDGSVQAQLEPDMHNCPVAWRIRELWRKPRSIFCKLVG